MATDTCGTYEVLLHALDYYKKNGILYDRMILLQPTSPFRTVQHVKEALSLYSEEIDMVVSVTECNSNPYYNCFEEDNNGFLRIIKGNGQFTRRQDCPKVYEYNGAIYVINISSLMQFSLSEFKKIKKYVMDHIHSTDLDNMLDWKWAEFLIKENIL